MTVATLMIIFKNECACPRIALYDLVDATIHLNTTFKAYELGLSFDDEDVKECGEEMLQVLKKDLHRGIIVATKRSCPSPNKVTEMDVIG